MKAVVTPNNLGQSLSSSHESGKINAHPEWIFDNAHWCAPTRTDSTAQEIRLLAQSSSLDAGYLYLASDTLDVYRALSSSELQSFEKAYSYRPNVFIRKNTTFADAARLDVDCLGGNYLFTVSYGWNCDSTGADFMSQILVDGSANNTWNGQLHRQEPKDHTGNVQGTQSSQAQGLTRQFPVSLASGPHEIKLQIRPEANNIEASVWGVLLMLEKLPAPHANRII